ncbi:hypothetical protein [Streptomyces sp. KR80]|uniref:hypothetical protein n=1 Tax=Streptomyces sp. KR80 TaxID=3457426 RepID=UPI003FD13E3D
MTPEDDGRRPEPVPPVTEARPGSDDRGPERPAPAEGCLTRAIRLPVRIVVLVLVVPVRMVWDALVVCGKALERTVLRPAARALGWLWRTLVVVPVTAVGRALAWLGRTLIVTALDWLWRTLLAPAGQGLGVALEWLARAVLVWPWVALHRYVLAPAGRGVAWLWRILVVTPLSWLWRQVIAPAGRGLGAVLAWLGRALFVWPWVALYRYVLAPVGRAVAWLGRTAYAGLAAAMRGIGVALAWLGRTLIVLPAAALYRFVLTPAGHGLRWLGRILLVVPAVAVWRWILKPVGHALAVVCREIGAALGHAWRVAGYISRAVWRFLARLFRWIFVEPVRWVYRTVLTPIGHAVRDQLWRPAAQAVRAVGRGVRQALVSAWESARQTRAEIRRALFGAPRREPVPPRTRTLGSSTTALTKD